MSHSQTAKVTLPQHHSVAPDKIDISQMIVSVNELLGYAYVFVSGDYAAACFALQATAIDAAEQFIARLKLNPEQVVFISVTEVHTAVDTPATTFTRHDITWVNRHLECLQDTLIKDPEQQEFINMIWQCSCEYRL